MGPIGFLLQMPDFKCTFSESVPIDELQNVNDDLCTVERICAGDPQIKSWQVDETSSRTLDNWVTKFDLMCVPKWKTALLPAIGMLAWTLTSLWLPRIADTHGRRKITIFG